MHLCTTITDNIFIVDRVTFVFQDQWFGQYNYNRQKNMEKYGQPEPPAYDLSGVAVPVALYHAQNDWLSTMEVN